MSRTEVLLLLDVSSRFRTQACSLALSAFLFSVRRGVEFSGYFAILYSFITELFRYINLYYKSDCAICSDPGGQCTHLQGLPLTVIVFIFMYLNLITLVWFALSSSELLLVMIFNIQNGPRNVARVSSIVVSTYSSDNNMVSAS
jgi:hypothetical protein